MRTAAELADAQGRASALSMGAALGQAIGAYRDNDTLECAAGLVQAVELLRQAELERDAALAAVGLLQHRIAELEMQLGARS